MQKNTSKLNFPVSVFLLFLAFFVSYNPLVNAQEPSRDYKRIVVLGDPHLPGHMLENKQKVVETVNSWPDVDLVVIVGDLCFGTGLESEYSAVKQFVSLIKPPCVVITGNHDYVFSDQPAASGGRLLATPVERSKKLDRFLKTFETRELSSRKELGGYNLLFLSTDDIAGQVYCAVSSKTLQWFDYSLFQEPNLPTLVFYHAPLWGKNVTDAQPFLKNFCAQPQDEFKKILAKHPNVFLWVSGHVHLGALNPIGMSPLNIFEKQITTINNCDMDGRSILAGTEFKTEEHDTIWTNSLYLYSDKVVVKTFDHKLGNWIPALERSFRKP
ncbi:MAG: metallophosphoesterase [Candidatus Ozemobacteraceae bacterium]